MPPEKEPTTEEPAKPMTLDDVNKIVNSALAAQKKAHKAELDSIRAEVAERTKPLEPPPVDEEKVTAKQLAKDLDARLKAAEAREAAKDAKIRKQRAESEWDRAWKAKGLDPDYAGDRLARLQLEGKVKVDDEDRVFVGDDPVDTHLEAWAKEKGGKYRPAKDAAGTGGGKGEPGKPAEQAAKPTKEQAGQAFIQQLFGGTPLKNA